MPSGRSRRRWRWPPWPSWPTRTWPTHRGWLLRSVVIIAGGLPSGSDAVLLGLVLLILARGLKLRRLVSLYLTASMVLWSAAMPLLAWDQIVTPVAHPRAAN